MAESNFVDYVKIYCRSGKGGRGSSHFRREKYIPRGGPDGGDGGDGGSVKLRGNRNYWTLLHLKYERHVMAEHGGGGSGSNSSGTKGGDKVIEVPCGTVVYDAHTGEYICDITDHGEEFDLLKGGLGGRGNTHFKTPTNRTPRYSQPGQPFQERWIIMELKLLADVGLVGFPNAGKSTLLSVVSAAKPKIANYHFTTIIPNLGVVEWKNAEPFVIADIPGLIENAHLGTGLGDQFLRHVERTKLLLHLLDVSGSEGRDPIDDFQIINEELRSYNEKLSRRKQLVILNKVDLLEDKNKVDEIVEKIENQGYEVFPISAATHIGLEPLLNRLVILLEEIGEVEPIFEVEVEREEIEKQVEKEFTIEQQGHLFIVKAVFLERLINSVNFDDLDSIGYFQRVLRDKGVFSELERMQIQDEDLVRLNEIEFEYYK